MHIHWTGGCPAEIEHLERIYARDENMRLKSELSQVRGELADARKAESEALKRVADFFTRKFMHGAIFSDTPETPQVEPESQPIARGKRQARDIVREKTMEAEQEIADWRKAVLEAQRANRMSEAAGGDIR